MLLSFFTWNLLYGALLYYFIDLLIIEAILRYGFGLKQLRGGNEVINFRKKSTVCFYVILDSRMESIEDLKSQIARN